MPKRDWRNGLAFGLIVGICLATLVYVYASFAAGEISCRHYGQGSNSQSSDNEGQNEKCNVPQWWGITQRLISSEDTLAQWIMAFISLAAVVVSAWAVLLVKDSLHFTTLALGEAKKANDISSQIGRAQVRAYVGIKSARVVRRSGIQTEKYVRFDVAIDVENSGQSPARNVLFQYGLASRDAHAPYHRTRPYASRHFDLGSGATNTQHLGFGFHVAEFGNLFVKINATTDDYSQNNLIFLDGAISYTDCFDIRRRFEWSYNFDIEFTGRRDWNHSSPARGHMTPDYVVNGKDTSWLQYYFVGQENVVDQK